MIRTMSARPTAVVATATRIGWNMHDALSAEDDLGNPVRFDLDSPAAIRLRVQESVVRWRWRTVAQRLPTLQHAAGGIHWRPLASLLDPARSARPPRGRATCLNAKTGEVIWGPERTAQGTVSSSPLLADGKIYLLNENAVTTVLAAGPEFKLLSTNELDGTYTLSTPVAVDSQLFIRTATHLYCIGNGGE